MAAGAVSEARVPALAERPHSTHAKGHEQLSRGTTVVTSMAAGAVAGALAKTTIAPLDRTKINFQISKMPYSWRGAYQFVCTSVRTEGVLSLWRGNSATMARIVPYTAVQFTAHEQLKKALGVDTPVKARSSPGRHVAAGALAGAVSQSATYPLDVARARLAVTSAAQLRSLPAALTQLARDQGPLALYRGYVPTVLGVIPYAGVSFFTYDTLKHIYMDVCGSAPAALGNMAAGGAAGALAQTASYPLDIVRRRMQVAAGGHYATVRDTVRIVYTVGTHVHCEVEHADGEKQDGAYHFDLCSIANRLSRKRCGAAISGNMAAPATTNRQPIDEFIVFSEMIATTF